MRASSGLARLIVACTLAFLAAACQVKVETNLTVDEDGSGEVEVAVGLDDDALERTGPLDALLRTDDLEASGWTVSPPVTEGDGLTWVRASKPFGEPAEAAAIIEEVSGVHGPLRDFEVARDQGLTTTSYSVTGVVDFTRGLEQFSDDELTDALDGEPLGEPVEAIEERFGAVIDELISFRLAVRMPGDVSSNAPTQLDNGAIWAPSITADEPLTLVATSQARDATRLVLFAVSVVAGFVALLFVLVRLALRIRTRREA